MPKGISCLCEQKTFYYPEVLEKKCEGFAFNVYCEKCERLIAIIITKRKKFVAEVEHPVLLFRMENVLINEYGIFTYDEVNNMFTYDEVNMLMKGDLTEWVKRKHMLKRGDLTE